MDIRIDGLDDLQRRLEALARRVEDLDGEHEVPLSELFPPKFMRRHTDFESVEALLDASDFDIESQEAFAAIPDADWDAFIARVTRFRDWTDMQEQGIAVWAESRLGL